MKIENIIQDIKQQTVRVRTELPSAKRQDSGGDIDGNKPNPAGINIDITSIQKTDKNENNQIKTIKNELFDLKPVFAIDNDKNVVIRFLDEKGEIVRQYPPEEYLSMAKKLDEIIESIYSKKV